MLTAVNPPGSAWPGVSQGVILKGSGVFVSTGHVGTSADGEIVVSSPEDQIVALFENLKATLTAADLDFANVARMAGGRDDVRRPFFMRHLPFYGWFGLLVILVSQAGVFARVEPFYHWHTPIAWTGYILLADAVVWKRRANSWIRNNRSELFFVTCASVPLWVVFELYNKYSIYSWYYVGLPELRLVRM